MQALAARSNTAGRLRTAANEHIYQHSIPPAKSATDCLLLIGTAPVNYIVTDS